MTVGFDVSWSSGASECQDNQFIGVVDGDKAGGIPRMMSVRL